MSFKLLSCLALAVAMLGGFSEGKPVTLTNSVITTIPTWSPPYLTATNSFTHTYIGGPIPTLSARDGSSTVVKTTTPTTVSHSTVTQASNISTVVIPSTITVTEASATYTLSCWCEMIAYPTGSLYCLPCSTIYPTATATPTSA